MRSLALALLHHPVLDRQGHTVTTAITTLDLHDLGRTARTYGLAQVYVVHPVAAQRSLALRIREHWLDGSGARRIPDRRPALALLSIVPTLEDACAAHTERPELWTTSALSEPACLSFADARERLRASGPPVLLCLGTGWGLDFGSLGGAGLRLAPIPAVGPGGYNHLSVRAAAAVMLDRLLGAS